MLRVTLEAPTLTFTRLACALTPGFLAVATTEALRLPPLFCASVVFRGACLAACFRAAALTTGFFFWACAFLVVADRDSAACAVGNPMPVKPTHMANTVPMTGMARRHLLTNLFMSGLLPQCCDQRRL